MQMHEAATNDAAIRPPMAGLGNSWMARAAKTTEDWHASGKRSLSTTTKRDRKRTPRVSWTADAKWGDAK